MAVTASQSALSGLPRRLVQDGIISEGTILDAAEGARKARMPLVPYLVANDLADSRAIAVAASISTPWRSTSTSCAPSIRSS
jgi:type IV pilus assembly protein PilB